MCRPTQYFLPMRYRLGMTAASMSMGSIAGSSFGGSILDGEETRGFLDRLCQPEVVAFFNDNRESLQALFLRYAMADAPSGSAYVDSFAPHARVVKRLVVFGAGVAWNSVLESNATLNEKEFLKFCAQLNIMPAKLARPELVAIYRRAVHEYATDSSDPALAYPEFVEVIAFLADFIFRCVPVLLFRLCSGRCNRCPSCRKEPASTTLLTKIHMLFFHMSDSGFKFQKQEFKVFQSVRRLMKQSLRCI